MSNKNINASALNTEIRRANSEAIRAAATLNATDAAVILAKAVAGDVDQRGGAPQEVTTESPILIHHATNGEESKYENDKFFTNFTKGLAHDDNGFLKENDDFIQFAGCIRDDSLDNKIGELNANFKIGDRTDDLELTWHFYKKLGRTDEDKPRPYRRWEAPTAGVVYEVQGPDAYSTYMPPAPSVIEGNNANAELVAEMAEVYWLALLRDVPFRAFDNITIDEEENDPYSAQIDRAVNYLKSLDFYQADGHENNAPCRRERRTDASGLNRNSVFRGQTAGDIVGPYLSQFLLLGTPRLGNINEFREADYKNGHVSYGSICMDLRVRQATPYKDYMTHWNEWLDVQNGANVRDEMQTYVPRDQEDAYRFVATPRDLATYVHFDALYEAYLNACITLLGLQAPTDPKFDHLSGGGKNNNNPTEGFALFGGPHILTLVTEVATRALKAVRFQKFNVHLRARPEVLAARIAYQKHNENIGTNTGMRNFDADMGKFVEAFEANKHNGVDLLGEVSSHNWNQNKRHARYLSDDDRTPLASNNSLPLLPMAFPEGSPMHPSYGAGHATVAGACVTMLKAFFNTDSVMVWDNMDTVNGQRKLKFVPRPEYDEEKSRYSNVAFVPSADGMTLEDVGHKLDKPLTLEDELNKLAANISIGRNMAGVHYYSDYIDSLRMGEHIAIGILREQAYTYQNDDFSLTVPRFDDQGDCMGEVQKVPITPTKLDGVKTIEQIEQRLYQAKTFLASNNLA